MQTAKWSELLSGRNGILSLALTGGMCLHAINTYISTTMLPSIVADIGGLHLYAWNTTLFMLAAILSAAISGNILNRLGPKSAYALGSIIFLVGSLISALASDMPMLIVGRTIQGAGGGLLFSFCYGMIMLVFEERLWPRAMALLSGVYGVALLIGPAIGGIFAELLSWRLGFAILVPITLLYMLLTSLTLPILQPRQDTTRIPKTQLFLLAAAVLILSLAGTRPELYLNLIGIFVAGSCIYRLAKIEQQTPRRLFPRGTFTPGSPLSLTLLLLAVLIFCVACEIYIPFYLQVLQGQTPLIAGYIAAMMSVGWVLAEILSAKLSGAAMHRAISYGPFIILIGMISLMLTVPSEQNNILLLSIISAALIAVGAGIGVGWPHLSTFALKFSPPEDASIAGSALSTVQQLSMAFGAALAGIVVNLSGFNETPGNAGILNSAFWLYCSFSLVAIFAIYCAYKVRRCLSA